MRGVLGLVLFVFIAIAVIVAAYTWPYSPAPREPATACQLSGFVVDATDGAPIGGATVTGAAGDGSGGPPDERDSWVVTTAGDGAWSHATICPQVYRLTVQVHGYSPSARSLGPGSASWTFELSRV